MKQILQVILVCGLTLSMVGCANGPSKAAIRRGSEMATLLSLQQTKASEDDAVMVHEISITAKDILDGNGQLDFTGLRSVLNQKIKDSFKAEDAVTYMLLVDSIADIVKEQLEDKVLLTNEELKIYILSAVDGVISGSQVYIEMLRNKDAELEENGVNPANSPSSSESAAEEMLQEEPNIQPPDPSVDYSNRNDVAFRS